MSDSIEQRLRQVANSGSGLGGMYLVAADKIRDLNAKLKKAKDRIEELEQMILDTHDRAFSSENST